MSGGERFGFQPCGSYGDGTIGIMMSRVHKPVWAAMAVAVVLAALFSPPIRRAWASNHSEYEVKAAYLYNFGRFVDWPPDARPARANDFAICVLGQDPFGTALDSTISGEKIDGKGVVARRVSRIEEA